MPAYELMVILRTELDEGAYQEIYDKVEGYATSFGGEILGRDVWGRRILSYPIKHNKEGYYVIFYFRCSPKALPELDRYLKVNESVIRFFMLNREGTLDKGTAIGKPAPPAPGIVETPAVVEKPEAVEAEAKPEPEVEAKEPEAEAKPEPEAEAKPEPEAEAKPEPEAEAEDPDEPTAVEITEEASEDSSQEQAPEAESEPAEQPDAADIAEEDKTASE